jgi:hypothetical protein
MLWARENILCAKIEGIFVNVNYAWCDYESWKVRLRVFVCVFVCVWSDKATFYEMENMNKQYNVSDRNHQPTLRNIPVKPTLHHT